MFDAYSTCFDLFNIKLKGLCGGFLKKLKSQKMLDRNVRGLDPSALIRLIKRTDILAHLLKTTDASEGDK